MSARTVKIERQTQETRIELTLNLDGSGLGSVKSGIGFLDHMLVTLARHSGMDLNLTCQGDLEVDDHHTVEDCALVLGQALDQALGERVGIARFGSAYAPLDESLARAVIDLSGRPFAQVDLQLVGTRIGQLACENLEHFCRSLAMASRTCLHLDVLRGDNNHHRAEAAFKALALALGQAVELTGRRGVPSTKGVL